MPRTPAWRCAAAVLIAGLTVVSCTTSHDAGQSSRGTQSAQADTAMPAHPKWKSAAQFGAYNTGGFIVYNNEWNKSQAGPQTIWADSYQSWGVTSRQPSSTSVKTYPSVQMDYDHTPYRSLTALTSTFAEQMPSAPSLDAEAAYDIWMNDNAIEVMIWVDNHGQRPSGDVIDTADVDGQEFEVWQGSNDMYTFALASGNETSGRIDILAFLRWLVNRGYLHSSDVLTQVDFGWEICSTGGQDMNFVVTSYSLSTATRQ